MMSGDANMNMLDESYRSMSDHIGNTGASGNMNNNQKGDGTTNKFEEMMAERQKEAMGQRQRF